MKVGIVGCGLNSDYHVNFSRAYSGSDIVGLVDRDRTRATECGVRHKITGIFSSIKDLVEQAKPDVVHIVTPPPTHFALAKEAIEAGCHVLIEKPMAMNFKEARELYNLAEHHNVKLCAIHNHFFDPCMMSARELIEQGALGQVINVESYYGLNTKISAFRDYPAPNVLPWIYNLPGGVYQDFLPHPLYVLLDYTGRPLEIKVMQQSHGVLPQGLPDEIRILINGERAFGTVTFSFAADPHLHFIRIYGTKMMVEVDINTMTTVVHAKSSLPKAAQKATYNLSEAWQLTTRTFSNVYQFLTKKLKPYQGMKALIHEFYDSIKDNKPTPVSKEQALLVIETMDEIFKQLRFKPLEFQTIIPNEDLFSNKGKKILVTGGTGFLGKSLVARLLTEGYRVRVLARKLSNIDAVKKLGAEVFWGDVADKKSLEAAFEGVDTVVHAAAGTSGNKKDCEMGTIQGTLNVLELCKQFRVGKLVYISSCSVYGVADYKKNQVVTEDSSLERFPARRGDYSASKQEAERIVTDAMAKKDFPIVILRPGTIWGPGGDLFTPMMGFSLGKLFVVIGNGKFELPFVYIDNLVEAIFRSIGSNEANNRTFNVVDSERMNKKEYIKRLIRPLYLKSKVVYLPFSVLYLMVWGQEKLVAVLNRKPFLTRYRLVSSQKHISYDNSRLTKGLNWRQKVSLPEAINQVIVYEKEKGT